MGIIGRSFAYILSIPLHWQIFISLLLALLLGQVYRTTYILDSHSFSKLMAISPSTVDKLVSLKETKHLTLSDFNIALKETLREEEFKIHGTAIREVAYHNPFVKTVHWMGILFLKLLKMLVAPLIIASIISGIVSVEKGRELNILGAKTVFYYISTSLLAIITGLLMANLIRPGQDINYARVSDQHLPDIKQQQLSKLLMDIVPENIFQALVNNDMLALIFVSLLVGVFITRLNLISGQLLTNLFQSLFELVMKITMAVIRFAPFGIFGLVIKVISDQESLSTLLKGLGGFIYCVTGALSIHAFITLPILLYLFGRTNPYRHFKNMATALLTALSTASSAAALPLTLSDLKLKAGVSDRVANFTVPIGTTVNMDGTAIYITAVVMFIAQASGISMGFEQQVVLVLAALLTSIGTAAIPMASLIIITLILDIFGLPFELVALILPVDRLLDMYRTSVNVWSDSCGAVIIDKTSRRHIG